MNTRPPLATANGLGRSRPRSGDVPVGKGALIPLRHKPCEYARTGLSKRHASTDICSCRCRTNSYVFSDIPRIDRFVKSR